jgi:hypothetical protein
VTRFFGVNWVACLVLLPLVASAQSFVMPDWKKQPERSDTVTSRERLELEPIGIPIEGYYFYPKFAYTALHTDNVFAVGDDTDADMLSIYSPGLTMASDWTRHGFILSGGADLGRYSEFTEENYDDWSVDASGWLDATNNSRLSGGLTYAQLHETRESSEDVNGLNPVKYHLGTAFVEFQHREGRFTLSPSANFFQFDYDNVKAVVLGRRTVIDQDYRDREEYHLGLLGAYQIGYKHELFLRARYIHIDYENPQILTGFDRSSEGYEAGAGMNFDLGGITHGVLYLGYRDQNYEQPLPDIHTPVYEFLLNWNATTLTTLQFGASQNILETTALFDSGYISSVMTIRIDHELRRNLFLHAEYSRVEDDYESILPGTRKDNTDGMNAGVKWIPNRNLELAFEFENVERDSINDTLPPDVDEGDFNEQIYWFRIEIRQ